MRIINAYAVNSQSTAREGDSFRESLSFKGERFPEGISLQGNNENLLYANKKILPNDIYVIFYTTKDGRTGHVGIAVDNYDIYVNEDADHIQHITTYDTVKFGYLTYYDLWGPTDLDYQDMNKRSKARYYKLPRSSAEAPITVDYFLTKGLPHSYDYPCDAVLKIKTQPKEDYDLKDSLAAIMEQYNYFHPMQYNCTDFVIKGLATHWQEKIDAKEFVFFAKSSTPNQLYLELSKRPDIEIIKKPGNEIYQSFFKERILKMFYQTE
ncbi:MAG: hypothetical protein AAGJ18_02490 [Bacteroidota bacterium]